ncbi:MAG: hypothetical protein NT033_10320, partial [Candidatus Omnitrophica bacterium]|nr:hypothetical protein [Candidatus Omnitrophota bacterium]
VEITKSSKKAILRLILLAFFVPILTIGFIERFNILKKLRNYYIGRNSQNNVAILDTGLLIGGWLKNNYSPQIKIWKDCEDFYVPDRFKNVYFKKEDINIEDKLLEIKRIAPDILIITSKFDETLANNTKVAKAM